MLIRKCLYINLLFAVWCKIASQTTVLSAIDTFKFSDTLSVLNLSNINIIESTLDVRIEEKKIEIIKFNFSESKIYLNFVNQNFSNLITVRYQYLNDEIPKVIGPKWKSFKSKNNTSEVDKKIKIEKRVKFTNNNNFLSCQKI